MLDVRHCEFCARRLPSPARPKHRRYTSGGWGLFPSATFTASYFWLCYLTLIISALTRMADGNWLYGAISGVSVPSSLRTSGHSSRALSELCLRMQGLNPQQTEICQQQPLTMPSVSYGGMTAIVECQWQFKYERWNCSLRNVINETEIDVLAHTLRSGNKENGFISAVTSAGIVYAITQGCSKGNLSDCGCDTRRRGGQEVQSADGGWRWGGCSDNVDYGMKYSKQFLDRYEKEQWRSDKNIKRLVDVHNHGVGRQAVKSLMRRQCRCHGVSGSCEFKTCWLQMSKFDKIGDVLKKRYDKFAVQVLRRSKKRLRRKEKSERKNPISSNEIVYMHRSPNYCNEDAQRGVVGTHNRECNSSSYGSDSCDLLCCGRGYNTRVETRRERCQCKFVYCCSVKCKVCAQQVLINTCK